MKPLVKRFQQGGGPSRGLLLALTKLREGTFRALLTFPYLGPGSGPGSGSTPRSWRRAAACCTPRCGGGPWPRQPSSSCSRSTYLCDHSSYSLFGFRYIFLRFQYSKGVSSFFTSLNTYSWEGAKRKIALFVHKEPFDGCAFL